MRGWTSGRSRLGGSLAGELARTPTGLKTQRDPENTPMLLIRGNTKVRRDGGSDEKARGRVVN